MIHHILIKLIFLGAPYCPFVDELVNEVIKAQASLPVKLSYEVEYQKTPLWWEGQLYPGQKDNLLHLRKLVDKHPKKTITIFISSGFYKDTFQYISGLSYGICYRNNSRPVSLSTYVDINYLGLSRHYVSAIAAAHELGHNACGCRHDHSEYSIMNSDAGRFASLHSMHYESRCIKECRRCLS